MLRYVIITAILSMSIPPLYAQDEMTPCPLVSGYNADPHIVIFGTKYYLYTTGYHCYSSPDLVDWTNHGSPFDLRTLTWDEDQEWMDKLASEGRTWTQKDPWAPAVVHRNDTYYFYFSCDHYFGIARGDSPEGPFEDAVGHTMYDRWDGIDPMTFIDDDGEAYVFFGYGGQFGGMAVGILNEDMISWKEEPVIIEHNTNGLVNYLEGPFMFKRNGIYYLTYSNDNWQTPNYNVQYCMADHPMGPYEHEGRILEKDDNHVGPGHHSILQIPGRDQWYIVYHRYSNTQTTDGVPRTTHIDTLCFNDDGTIQPVIMTSTGVHGVNLADLPTPVNSPRKKSHQKPGRWHPLVHLEVDGKRILLQSGDVSGSIELFASNGISLIHRTFKSGEKLSLSTASPGVYIAELSCDGSWYHKRLALF